MRSPMRRLPTDREILEAIYRRYYPTFADSAARSSKVYVPVDLASIAREFKVDADIIFGRLYYYLDKKHGYKQDDGTLVPLFSLKVGEDSHCVNFPLLASVLASLQSEHLRARRATIISIISLILSALALGVSAISLWFKVDSRTEGIRPAPKTPAVKRDNSQESPLSRPAFALAPENLLSVLPRPLG
jgi:hypothetical protein